MNNDRVPLKIESISELHHLMHLPKPKHPLLSLMDNCLMEPDETLQKLSFTLGLYVISYKESITGKMGYGQGYYDFDEGGMMFTAPNQLIASERNTQYRGFTIFMHPDFVRNYPLGKNIRKYGFFGYDTNEALHLSESEKNVILGLFKNIETELNTAIDETSQDVLVSYIEVLLNYSQRFYRRQFITRKTINHDFLVKIEHFLNDYLDNEKGLNKGSLTVEYLAERVNLSPRYLSDMLRNLMGQNAQQLIHEKLIDKAKEYLSTTNLSVAEIAFTLGFEYPQSFNKLFRKKTNVTPLEFRASFN
jgi:AraC family transcriptional regulator, transcriptional activator of pobA